MYRASVSLATALVAATAIAVPSSATAAGNTYYATTGTPASTACSFSDPCSLNYVLGTKAQTDDEVVLKTSGSSYLQTGSSFLAAQNGVYLHSEDPAHPATITSNISYPVSTSILYATHRSRFANINVVATVPATSGHDVTAIAMDPDAVLSNVQVSSVGFGVDIEAALAIGPVGGIFNSSILATTSSPDAAVEIGNRTSAIYNSTIWAAGPLGRGIALSEFSADTELDVHNSIVRGASKDITATGNGLHSAIVSLDHSNFDSSRVVAASAVVSSSSTNGNQSATPLLAAPASTDFHQLAGSPTINAGSSPFFGLDIDQQSRLMGCAPDIGADEYLEAPCPVATAAVRKLTLSTPSIKSRRKHGKVYVKIKCPKAAIGSCKGKLSIKQGSKRAKTTTIKSIKAGKSATTKARAKKGKASITVTLTDSGGAVGTKSVSKRLK